MKNFKVVEAFELDGVMQEVDSVVSLSEDQATEFSGKVEEVVEEAAEADVDQAAE